MKKLKEFLDEYLNGIVALIGVLTAIILFVVYTQLDIVFCIWFGFLSGSFFVLLPFLLIKERFSPSRIPHTARPSTSIGPHQVEEDLEVVLTFCKQLESLRDDDLVNPSFLKYPIKRIEDACGRLKQQPRLPAHLQQAIQTVEYSLNLFRGNSD